MFLKLTIIFTFLEGKTDDETRANTIYARNQYEEKNERVILLNVDTIHSISPAKMSLKGNAIAGSLVKYRSSKGELKGAFVREVFADFEKNLT